jgi:molybdate transport system substrate-binding protein
MTGRITVVSSMATKAVLIELARAYEVRSQHEVVLESISGVAAAVRVRAGEPFDVVVLAGDTIDKLIEAGRLDGSSRVDVLRSDVAVAVRAGALRPEIGSEDALKRAVLAARTIGHSTGPSGIRLAQLFQRWGISDELRGRVVVAPPGIPVGSLVAEGKVELGFQQCSELMGIEGIDVLGTMPRSVQIITTFSAAIGAGSHQPDAARAFLDFLISAEVADAKRRQRMEPA